VDQDHTVTKRFVEKLANSGLRSTTQRQHVYTVLLETTDHPTAEDIFIRTKQTMPDISIATVYNCLDALVKCDLVRQVKINRGATRYCPNMREHCHFFCEECGKVYDVDLMAKGVRSLVRLPDGFTLTQAEVSLKGLCQFCASVTS
jgi:Fur family transcriptional regulator, peroxide stress response regulator